VAAEEETAGTDGAQKLMMMVAEFCFEVEERKTKGFDAFSLIS